MTQQELADALGMARPYIAAVESGKRPFSAKLQRKITESVSFRGLSVSNNHGAIGSPGAHVHNNSPALDEPPKWAQELQSEVAKLRDQLADILALLVKLMSK